MQGRWDDNDGGRHEYIADHGWGGQSHSHSHHSHGHSSYGHGSYNQYGGGGSSTGYEQDYSYNYDYGDSPSPNRFVDGHYDPEHWPNDVDGSGQRESGYSAYSTGSQRIDFSNPHHGYDPHATHWADAEQAVPVNGYDHKYDPNVNSYYEGKYDNFLYGVPPDPYETKNVDGFLSADERDLKDEQLRSQNPFFRALNRLFGSGVEARGIERVPEEERDGTHTIGLLLLWWSVNCVVSTFPIGLLAQMYFKLSFRMAVTAIVVFTAVGAAFCAFIATLGPKTGLRTIVISRYSVGFVGGTIFAIFNILTQLGFSCTAVILGGQTLTNVSEGKLPLQASIVIVGFIALILCFVGYEAVHYWERFAWLIQATFYVCILVLGGLKGYHVNNDQSKMSTGKEFAGGFLSFGGIVFSSAAGWAPIAADFNCRLPHNISSVKVFVLTWLGLMVPLLFIEITSAAIITVPAYAAAFETGDAGGVLFEIFRPWRAGGKFILVVMSFSIIANVAPNTYSASLSAQTLLPIFQKIPRAVWCIVMFGAYTGAAIGGREHFSEVLSNFLSILGYWVAFFFIVILEEHVLFRPYLGYDLTAYNSIRRLPVGVAGILACCVGAGCAVVGMAQVWFIGPVGKLFGKEGGDLGFEMAMAGTAVTYPVLRWIEIKIFDR